TQRRGLCSGSHCRSACRWSPGWIYTPEPLPALVEPIMPASKIDRFQGPLRGALAVLAALSVAAGAVNAAEPADNRTVSELRADLDSRKTTSVELVQAFIRRIETIDRNGPQLRSVISINPKALDQARALDKELRSKGPRSPMHGIPVLVKDNIETADPMPTTAGSLALIDNVTRRDAPVIANLREAGAIILGKTNLSEWANFRSTNSISGWS